MRRRRPSPALALALALAAVALGLAAVPAGQQRETRDRHVYVGVTTGNNLTPVEGLTPADFTVREDGIAREVLRVGPAPMPSHIAVLVDDSGSVQPFVTDLRNGLGAFVRGMLGGTPEPQFGLTTFGERPTRVVPYALDAAAVLAGIDRIFGRPNSGSYLLDAIIDETAALRKAAAERPVIVVFANEEGPEFSNPTADRVAEALKSANASLWTVALQSRSQDLTSSEARERAAVLVDVARRSGGDGRSVLSRQALTQTFTRLAAQITARYDVVYARPDTTVPPEKLQVEVKRSGVRVAAPVWTGR